MSPHRSTSLSKCQGSTSLTTCQGSTSLSTCQGSTSLSTCQRSTSLSTCQGSASLSTCQGSTSLTTCQGSTSLSTCHGATSLSACQGSTSLSKCQGSTSLYPHVRNPPIHMSGIPFPSRQTGAHIHSCTVYQNVIQYMQALPFLQGLCTVHFRKSLCFNFFVHSIISYEFTNSPFRKPSFLPLSPSFWRCREFTFYGLST